jgi:hypothetical protein
VELAIDERLMLPEVRLIETDSAGWSKKRPSFSTATTMAKPSRRRDYVARRLGAADFQERARRWP